MFNVYQHVLPLAKAWRTTIDKPLTRFFKGLGDSSQDVRDTFDDTFDDVNPQTTRNIDAYEDQFGLPTTVLTEQQRRDRIDAAWKAQGGQDPTYIQGVLRANGFDVYIHEWWEEPVPVYVVECGEPIAECGEPVAQCGDQGGAPFPFVPTARNPFDVLSDGLTFTGYTLSCDASTAVCGGVSAISGASTAATGKLLVNLPAHVVYNIPTDPADWPYILYFGGEIYGSKAQIDLARRAEFEALCLKICPAQQWIGLLVEYS